MIRISITGPESTGKSALSKQLAMHFGGICVPEFAREYLELNGPNYNKDTVELIAVRQLELQNQKFDTSTKVVFFDTDLLVCQIWMEHVYNECPTWIYEAISRKEFDLTLLMQVDLPWEDDPLREHPRERNLLFTKYYDALIASSQKFEIALDLFFAEGLGETRAENANQQK